MEKRISFIVLFFFVCILWNAMAKAGTHRFYTIQFSSETTKAEADRQIRALKSMGIDAFQNKKTVGGRVHYRVFAGYFDDARKAKEARDNYARIARQKTVFVQSLKSSEIPDSLIFGNAEESAKDWVDGPSENLADTKAARGRKKH